MNIQWYPGHMAKARRMLSENLKLVDAVVELVDARAPRATRNPDFDDLFAAKDRVILLNKSDLADPAQTKAWIAKYKRAGIAALAFNALAPGGKKEAVALIERAAAPTVAKYKAKGVSKVVRAMVVGIPNVGKSTFINRLAGGAKTQVGDKPGVTKGKQWVKISPYLEVMDTPGLLWPKLEDETLARHLAYIGSVKDEVLDGERLAAGLLLTLMALCPAELTARYKACGPGMTGEALLAAVCQSRSFLLPGGAPDTDRAARVALDEFRACKIARVTLDKAEDEGE